MARGSIRKRGDRYYVRTRVRAINPDTGKVTWRQVERKVPDQVDAKGKRKPAGYRAAQLELEQLQSSIGRHEFKPTATTVHELGQRWLKEHVQRDLKPSTAANYKGTFYLHISPILGPYRVDEITREMIEQVLERKRE